MDSIADFEMGTDEIDLSGAGLSEVVVRGGSAGATVDLGGGNGVLLEGVSVSAVSGPDFALTGGGGLATLEGATGADRFVVGAGADVVVENFEIGVDKVDLAATGRSALRSILAAATC